MTILLKVFYRYNAIPTKIIMTFFFLSFCRNRKSHPKIHMNFKEAQTVKTILKKNNKVGGLILAEFKICYKATVIQIVWYCTGLDIWIKEPKWKLQIHPYIYGQLTFDNSVKVIQWKKHSPSNK